MNFCIPCEFLGKKTPKQRQQQTKQNNLRKNEMQKRLSVLFSNIVFLPNVKQLGSKTEYSYVTRNHMASFPFRILKPETSFNMCMPTMTLCSQKVNGPLRSKVQSSSSHSGKGCLSGELKGDDELLFFFFP